MSGCERFWGLASGLGPVPSACGWPRGPPLLWDKALCVLQEGAHGWLVDNEAPPQGLRS